MLPEPKYPSSPYSKLLVITIKDKQGNIKEIEGHICYYNSVRDKDGKIAGGNYEWVYPNGYPIHDEVISWKENEN